MRDFGPRTVGSTIYIDFPSRDVNDSPVTLSADANFGVFKNGATSPVTTGMTLTKDIGGVTGANLITINTAASGVVYSADAEFVVKGTAGTSDGISIVGMPVGSFHLNNIESSVGTINTNVGTPSNLGSGATLSANTADLEALTDDLETTVGSISAGVFSVDNTPLVQSRVIRLGTRHDQVSRAFPDLAMRTGDLLPFWIDTTKYCGGLWLVSATSPASSDEQAVLISTDDDDAPRVGVNRELAVVWLDALFEDGHDTAEITLNVTPHGGQAVPISFTVSKASDET